MTDEEYQIRRKYENRNLMQELKWVSSYPPSGMSDQDKDFIRWLAMTAYDRINELERKTGKWKLEDDGTLFYRCSACGKAMHGWFAEIYIGDGHFCPNCGADMMGEH